MAKVLSSINRYYYDIELPEFDVFKKNLEEANRDIVDNAFKCNDPSDLQFEEAIGADVAEVRNAHASRAFQASHGAWSDENESPEIPMRYSYMTNSSYGMLNNEGVLNHGMLTATKIAFGMSDTDVNTTRVTETKDSECRDPEDNCDNDSHVSV